MQFVADDCKLCDIKVKREQVTSDCGLEAANGVFNVCQKLINEPRWSF